MADTPDTSTPPVPAPAPGGLLHSIATAIGSVVNAADPFKISQTPAAKTVETKITPVVNAVKQEAKETVTNPKKRTQFLTGLVQPGGEVGEGIDFSELGGKKVSVKPKATPPVDMTPAYGETGKPVLSSNEAPTVLGRIADSFGTHTNAAKTREGATFIQPDGKFISLPAGEDHPQVIANHGYSKDSPDDRVGFINESGAVRTNYRVAKAGKTLAVSVPSSGVTPEQMDAIQQAVGQGLGRNGNLIIESAASPTDMRSQTKEFASPADVEPMLKTIGAHPEQKSPNIDNTEVSPNIDLQTSAQKYAKSKSMPEINHAPVPVDETRAVQIANNYDAAVHDPDNPRVKASYDAMKSETKDQFNHLRNDLGLKFEPQKEDPYNSAAEMMNDIKQNNRLKVFTGSSTGPDHPLSDIDPETGESYNTIFRWVHDAMGHAAGGNDFSEAGEKSATETHAQMYSDLARPAMRNETEGQTSWFFHNPEVQSGRAQPGAFAEQKANLLPDTSADWHTSAGKLASNNDAGAINPRTGKTDSKGVGVELMPELRQPLDHAPTAEDFQKFYSQHQDIFDQNPELRVGWDNNSAAPGGHEINVGAVGPDAPRVAKKLDQQSAFDITKGENIPTGGAGTRTSFPNYSLDERLKDLKGENQSNVKGFEHLSKDIYKSLEPDERDYIKNNKVLQRNVMSQYHRLEPSVAETTNAMQAGAALGGWWNRYIDVFHGLAGEPELPEGTMWHGTPSGDLRGGVNGLHVGTKQAAKEALDSRIGVRADGKNWDGTQEYGKTKLAGKKTLLKLDPRGYNQTGVNDGGPGKPVPDEDYYPSEGLATYSDRTPVSLTSKPNLMPVKITGPMKNTPAKPVSDFAANRLGADAKQRVPTSSGAYYKNMGEDAGSISAVLPGPSHVEQIANTIGPSHAEVLKQWHAAVSGNKLVEDANNLAWHSYADWLDAGKPTDRKSIDDIVRKNGAQPVGSEKKGNASISDTYNRKGKLVSGGLDTGKLFLLINSPEMRGEKPFSGDVFREDAKNPLMGPTEGARKIPSMGATVAGKGNLNRLVIDTHIRDFYGQKSQGSAAQYIADSAHLRQAAKALGLKGGEGQEQLWGTVLGLKTLLKEGLTPEDASGKLNANVINKIGKDYAEVIANDPEITKPGGLLDRLKEKYGIGRGSAGVSQANRQTSSTRAASKGKPAGSQAPVDTSLLGKTSERIRGTISETKIKKPAEPKPAFAGKSKFSAVDFMNALGNLKKPAK